VEGQDEYEDLPVVNDVYDYLGDIYDFYSIFHGPCFQFGT